MAAPKEVFVSHANSDRKFVGKLTAVLERHAIPFWYSTKNLVGAQQWHDEIGKALKTCDWFLLVLSPDAVVSQWVKRELLYALSQRRFEERIVPVLHRHCDHEELSWTLANFQMVDFSMDFATGCRDLLKIWGIGYRSDSDPSSGASIRRR